MNAKLKLLTCFITVAFLAQPLCADFFENLDFEDVVVGGSIELTSWETNAEFLNYNNLCLGSICTSIHDDDSDFFQPLEGVFSVHLDPGTNPGLTCAIWQLGTVPTNATSLTILVDTPDPDFFQVAFDGMPLTLLSQSLSQPWVYDISTFSGVTGELRISQIAPDLGLTPGVLIDDIQFIPEPSSALLAATICLLFIGSKRSKRQE